MVEAVSGASSYVMKMNEDDGAFPDAIIQVKRPLPPFPLQGAGERTREPKAISDCERRN